MALTRTGLLIIRLWTEPASSNPLRARIRMTTNVAAGIESELTIADMQSICSTVEAWLHDFMAAEP